MTVAAEQRDPGPSSPRGPKAAGTCLQCPCSDVRWCPQHWQPFSRSVRSSELPLGPPQWEYQACKFCGRLERVREGGGEREGSALGGFFSSSRFWVCLLAPGRCWWDVRGGCRPSANVSPAWPGLGRCHLHHLHCNHLASIPETKVPSP